MITNYAAGTEGTGKRRPGRRALSDWALSELYELIFSGRLAAGDPIGENEATELLGVSRTPIRDALRRLEESDLLDVSPTTGRRTIKRFEADDIHELYSIRMSLESLAIHQAAERITEEELSELDRLLEQMMQAARSTESPALGYEADFRFHEVICRAGGMPRVMRLLSAMWLQTRALLHHLDRVRVYPSGDERLDVTQDHETIRDCLRQRDPDAAAAAVEAHLRVRRDRLVEAVRVGS